MSSRFSQRLTDRSYFSINESSELLETVPFDVVRRTWFMHDDAPPYFRRVARHFTNKRFRKKWIGRAGRIA